MSIEKYFLPTPGVLHPGEIEAYRQYYRLLSEWNQKINLVSRKSFSDIVPAHFVDSMFISDLAYRYLDRRPLFDIGSGGGFPGIIFAIRYPKKKIFLYEKVQKKGKFLSLVVKELRLENVEVGGYFGSQKEYGFFLARAVLPPEKLFPFMKKNTKSGSRFFLLRGGGEKNMKVEKGFHKLEELEYQLPENHGQRKVDLYEYRFSTI